MTTMTIMTRIRCRSISQSQPRGLVNKSTQAAPSVYSIPSEPEVSHTEEKREQPGELIALVRKQLADLSKTVETCAVVSGARDDKLAESERENTELHNKVKGRSQEILQLRMKVRQADNARGAEKESKKRLLAEKNDSIKSMKNIPGQYGMLGTAAGNEPGEGQGGMDCRESRIQPWMGKAPVASEALPPIAFDAVIRRRVSLETKDRAIQEIKSPALSFNTVRRSKDWISSVATLQPWEENWQIWMRECRPSAPKAKSPTTLCCDSPNDHLKSLLSWSGLMVTKGLMSRSSRSKRTRIAGGD